MLRSKEHKCIRREVLGGCGPNRTCRDEGAFSTEARRGELIFAGQRCCGTYFFWRKKRPAWYFFTTKTRSRTEAEILQASTLLTNNRWRVESRLKLLVKPSGLDARLMLYQRIPASRAQATMSPLFGPPQLLYRWP